MEITLNLTKEEAKELDGILHAALQFRLNQIRQYSLTSFPTHGLERDLALTEAIAEKYYEEYSKSL